MRSTGSSAWGSSRSRRETGNPRTVGRRYDPRALTDALVRAAGDVRLQAAVPRGPGPRDRRLRAHGWRASAACSCARRRGARATGSRSLSSAARARRPGWSSSTGARCPAPVPEDEFVRASQLYARHALVLDDEGRDLGDAAWHESDIVQRFPGGKAWYVVDARALREPVRERTVADLVEAAREAGGDVRPAEQLPFALPASPKLAEPPFLAVRVYAGVTHTIGGLRIDDRARVLDGAGSPIAGPLRGRRRRRRDLHRRLRQRPRGRARLRPDRGRDRARPRRAACTRRGGGRPGAATGRSC